MRTENILLVDDEQGILDMLVLTLKKENFIHVTTALNGSETLNLVKNHPFDIILLDVMLPDIDGFELCRQIRNYTNTPILFVTARSSDLDKLTGLGIGGDDYITKPFNPLEVAARINVQLRGQSMLLNNRQAEHSNLHFESFSLYPSEGLITVNGKSVHCTAKELELLTFLCTHPNRIFTAEQLYEQVWGLTSMGDDKTVVMHISKLRKKIEEDPKSPTYIVNLRGIGYKFIPHTKEQQK
ncbi:MULTISPECIES: response regulator transcription factor [Bacillus]|uniref:response regulator transcription factor n=1 Tax=Bacillus TaxID=1386 RepID=UPI00031259D8|nr:response regulator transcription factor [Bacillus pseudomycoides]MED1596266.1 response regulator transcription factor [Bacillus pseudomycoides]MED4710062.1 response regulator transcription factor [Bacillus pseudomycoides]OOR54443.1 DNA-binding response regulator [Bacillus pseudomycoides]PDY10250.1 DNA-binding response regulator [Bacillus pseudomycoides]PEU42574.1 DNA-binding response regulator [Bacillus pseudomycoides]